ncbi:DUF6650 family protein [Sphingomonas kyeonggiensis]|uniref:Uncharacterized protein n=1 Tax=Sphingomonas kyeonggiensis TaxID=1268553 RepID=A0A7W6JXV0_9SPHN|nr:DUF6650 family protein [Sphingomonas kyeonggiensis]MBB4100472.1 hypothetical protein [Sphingomonas kyeonggiensis]
MELGAAETGLLEDCHEDWRALWEIPAGRNVDESVAFLVPLVAGGYLTTLAVTAWEEAVAAPPMNRDEALAVVKRGENYARPANEGEIFYLLSITPEAEAAISPGASWQPSAADRDVAAELLVRLEDRRVLYNPGTAEVPHHCIQSIVEIRRLLSDALVKASAKGVLSEHLRALGAACRRFLDRVGSDGDDHKAMRSHGHYLSWEFLDALGQLRAIFGIHIALVAAEFDLEVRGELTNILPPEPKAGDWTDPPARRW